MIDLIVKATLTGVIAAILLVYAFNNKRAYPRWMLSHYDNPWLWIPIVIVIVFIYSYDITIFVLLVLMLLSIHSDIVILGRPHSESKEHQVGASDLGSDDLVTWGPPLNQNESALYYSLHN